MDISRAAQALAEASSSLTKEHDVAGSLAALLDSCKEGLGVDVGGVLVASSRGSLELLAASSHRASELEVHQLHVDEGPCVDAFREGATVQLHSPDALLERWPSFAPTMIEAEMLSVHASPLAWRGEPFGAMGLFRRSGDAFTDDEDVMARAFADIAATLVLNVDGIDPARLAERLDKALRSRVTVEQAKGVLADRLGVDMAEAYDRLVGEAVEHGHQLTDWAQRVVDGALRLRP